jgi:flagellar basal-body rod protein FlgG
MDSSMITSAVTMGQIQQKIDLIANNLSNAGTNGYKSRDSEFTALLSQQIQNLPPKADSAGRLTPTGIRMGTGAAISDTQLNMAQGAIKKTDRALDLALTDPHHFFQVSVVGSDGTTSVQYTRDGTFYLSPGSGNGARQLVDAAGNYVLDANGSKINIPANLSDIKFHENGAIDGKLPNGQTVSIGTLGLVNISRPQLLQAQGGNLFTLPNLQALGLQTANVIQTANGQGSVMQGALEGSNVDTSKELTDLIGIQRAYQFNARALSISDQMMGLINNLR